MNQPILGLQIPHTLQQEQRSINSVIKNDSFQRNSILGSMPRRPSSTSAKLNISVQNWSSGFSHKAWFRRKYYKARAWGILMTKKIEGMGEAHYNHSIILCLKAYNTLTYLVVACDCSSKVILRKKGKKEGHQ